MPQVPHARRIPCYWALTLIGWTRGLSFRIILPGRVALRALWRTPTQTDHWAHPFERSLNPHLNDLIMAPLRAPPFAHWKLNMSLDVQWTSQWARAHLVMVVVSLVGTTAAPHPPRRTAAPPPPPPPSGSPHPARPPAAPARRPFPPQATATDPSYLSRLPLRPATRRRLPAVPPSQRQRHPPPLRSCSRPPSHWPPAAPGAPGQHHRPTSPPRSAPGPPVPAAQRKPVCGGAALAPQPQQRNGPAATQDRRYPTRAAIPSPPRRPDPTAHSNDAPRPQRLSSRLPPPPPRGPPPRPCVPRRR